MSKSKTVLVIACVLALMMVMDRLSDFVISRIPPFKAGECFTVESNTPVLVKILKNHFLESYSDVEVDISIVRQKGRVSFEELRDTLSEKVNCPL